MKVLSSVPENGGTISRGETITLTFSKPLDPSTFTAAMLYIEYNSSSVDFTYQIDGNTLSVTPNAQYNGKYYLFLYGTDIVAGLRLLSTDGEFLTESY